MSTATEIKALLQRYRNGACSPEEVKLLEQWFEQVKHENDKEGLLTQEDEERIISRFKTHMQLNTAPKGKTVFLRRFSRIAAAVWLGVFLSAGIVTWLAVRHQSTASGTPAFMVAQTYKGNRKRVLLPDSSVVWLNSESVLSWHPNFINNRLVVLKGEAFFDVTHDEEHPFRVQAGKAVTKVYGTAFNISARDSAAELRIALQRGRIGISYDSAAAGTEKILSPGQLFIYDNKKNTARITDENIHDMDGWISGKLIFNQLPLHDVLAQLERTYHVTVVYAKKTDNPLVTARFDKALLNKILTHLSYGWDVHFNQHADTLYVK